MPFEFVSFEISGLRVIKPRVFGDDRGCFLELYKHSDFFKAGIIGVEIMTSPIAPR